MDIYSILKKMYFYYFILNEIQELGNVEKKIEELSKEIARIKEENAALRLREEQSLKEISGLQEEKDNYKKEYKGLKQINRALEKDIQEVRLENYYICSS